MPRAYTIELRTRVVAAYNDGEGTYNEIAERFKIGPASVDRWLLLDRTRQGDLTPGHPGGATRERKVTPEGEAYLRSVLEVLPETTLRELAELYEQEFGTQVHLSTMGRTLKRMGFTRKRGFGGRRKRTAPTWSDSGKPSSRR